MNTDNAMFRMETIIWLLPVEWQHNLALKTDGSLVAWGECPDGQYIVPGINDFIAIAAGLYHSLALRADGSIAGMGLDQ